MQAACRRKWNNYSASKPKHAMNRHLRPRLQRTFVLRALVVLYIIYCANWLQFTTNTQEAVSSWLAKPEKCLSKETETPTRPNDVRKLDGAQQGAQARSIAVKKTSPEPLAAGKRAGVSIKTEDHDGDNTEKLSDDQLRRQIHRVMTEEEVRQEALLNANWQAAEKKPWKQYENIAIIIRTGYNVQSRVSGPLSTYLKDRGEDSMVIMSDRQSTIMGRPVHDCIKPFFDRLPKRFDNSTHWSIYHSIQNSSLVEDKAKPGDHTAGWKLDIMKETMAADYGYQMLHKNRKFDWWLLLDDDCYVHMPGLAEALKRLDPMEPHYLGEFVFGFPPFAHGGSGIVLSHKAMRLMFDDRELADDMHVFGTESELGDLNLAVHYEEKNITVDGRWTTSFHGCGFDKLNFTKTELCKPIFTLHSLMPPEMEVAQQILRGDEVILRHDLFKRLPEFEQMDFGLAVDHSFVHLTFDYLAMRKELYFEEDGRRNHSMDHSFGTRITQGIEELTLDRSQSVDVRREFCTTLCRMLEHPTGEPCISWAFVAETSRCYMAPFFMLNTKHKRPGVVSGLLQDRLDAWKQMTCNAEEALAARRPGSTIVTTKELKE